MRNLTLAGKITIFKSLAISKIVYISYLSHVPPEVFNYLQLIHKKFIWHNKKAKIKHSTLISDYCDGGLKDVDIRAKITALHLSWLKCLYDTNFHPWKHIPNFLFGKISKCSSNIFYPNFNINIHELCNLPLFYKNLVLYWTHFSTSEPKTTSSVLSESIWNNSYIKIELQSLQPSFLGLTQHIFVRNLLDQNSNFLSWDIFRANYNIDSKMAFKWIQLKNCIPSSWKKLVKTNLISQQNLCDFDPHINVNARICSIKKLTIAEIYKIL